jgi:hypothetical protein
MDSVRNALSRFTTPGDGLPNEVAGARQVLGIADFVPRESFQKDGARDLRGGAPGKAKHCDRNLYRTIALRPRGTRERIVLPHGFPDDRECPAPTATPPK